MNQVVRLLRGPAEARSHSPCPSPGAKPGRFFLILHYSCERLEQKRTRPATEPGPQSRKDTGPAKPEAAPPASHRLLAIVSTYKVRRRQENGPGPPATRSCRQGRAIARLLPRYCARGAHQAGADRSGLHVHRSMQQQRGRCPHFSAALRASSRLPASGWCNLRCCTAPARRRLFLVLLLVSSLSLPVLRSATSVQCPEKGGGVCLFYVALGLRGVRRDELANTTGATRECTSTEHARTHAHAIDMSVAPRTFKRTYDTYHQEDDSGRLPVRVAATADLDIRSPSVHR